MKRMKLKMNPIFKNEMKLLSRSIRFPIVVFVYNALLTLISLLVFYMSFGSNQINYEGVLSVYMTTISMEFVMIAFFVPSFSAGSVAGERERQTLDLLLTTKMKPIQIIMGKLASSISSVLILILTSLPVIAIVFSIGGVYVKDLIQVLFLALVMAIYFGSVSVFFSTKTKRTISASVLSYATILAISLGTYFLITLAGMIQMFQARTVTTYAMPYTGPDVGNYVLVLLINPIFTVLSAFVTTSGLVNMKDVIFGMGKCNQFIINHWFVISVAVQMVISALLLWRAAENINPMKRKVFKKEVGINDGD